jgi:deoxyribonuclease IV
MLRLGVHLSISGGMHHALEKAEKLGIQAVQIFLKNSNQWNAKPYTADVIRDFNEARARIPKISIFAHSGYLINLAGEGDTLVKSIKTCADELNRASLLGIDYLVLHPGSHGGRGIESGIDCVADSLNQLLDGNQKTMILLETTAGQGSSIGYRFKHLGSIIDKVSCTTRIGICLDTCHVFAAGYDFTDRKKLNSMLKEFNDTIGLDRLRLIHINDSKRECGSRVDRHEHIGKGCIGTAGFRLLLNSTRLQRIPFILETPKFNDDEGDRINLKTLRRLINT